MLESMGNLRIVMADAYGPDEMRGIIAATWRLTAFGSFPDLAQGSAGREPLWARATRVGRGACSVNQQ